MKRILLATACAWAIFAQPTFAAPGEIDPALLADHIKVLSSDAFEGRGPATPGEVKTVQFMTDQFKAVGLQPGGDLKDGKRAWTQDVPLAKFDITGPISVGVKVAGQTQAWTQVPSSTEESLASSSIWMLSSLPCAYTARASAICASVACGQAAAALAIAARAISTRSSSASLLSEQNAM